jgi:hypothetical protein
MLALDGDAAGFRCTTLGTLVFNIVGRLLLLLPMIMSFLDGPDVRSRIVAAMVFACVLASTTRTLSRTEDDDGRFIDESEGEHLRHSPISSTPRVRLGDSSTMARWQTKRKLEPTHVGTDPDSNTPDM